MWWGGGVLSRNLAKEDVQKGNQQAAASEKPRRNISPPIPSLPRQALTCGRYAEAMSEVGTKLGRGGVLRRVGVMMPFSTSSQVAVAAEPYERIADGALDRMTGILKLTNGFRAIILLHVLQHLHEEAGNGRGTSKQRTKRPVADF